MQCYIPRFLRGSTGISVATTIGFVSLLLLPEFAHAAFGTLIPPACNCDTPLTANGVTAPSSAPAWGCVFATLQNALTMAVQLATVLISIFLALAGFTYMTSGGSAEKRQLANKRLVNAVIGLLIVLGAYLLVDSLMKVIYNAGATDGTTSFGPWNAILVSNGPDCLAPTKPPKSLAALTGAEAGSNASGGSGSAGTAAVPAGGGGTCTVPSSDNNPCSVQSLSGTCFASSGSSASQVCMLESAGGQQAILSGSDKLNSGSGPSYSVGLWQINLTTTQVGGLNCPAAFSAPCSGAAIHGQAKVGWCSSTVTNQSLYQQCVAAAQIPQNNSQAACSLYNSKLSAWKCSASRCSVPGAQVMSGSCAP
jgi:hypothetical protein